MPSPFPGMDPYLEDPTFWSDFHSAFLTYLRDALNDALPDNYQARLDEKVNLVEEEQRERWIEILHRPDRSLVTVMELLSPTNKEEPGFRRYLDKRIGLLWQNVHLVEVDLLLGGHRLPLRDPLPLGNYYYLVSRSDHRPDCEVHSWTLQQQFPGLPVPLIAPDPDLVIDLRAIFNTAYDRGRYRRSLRYNAPPTARLPTAACDWVLQTAAQQSP